MPKIHVNTNELSANRALANETHRISNQLKQKLAHWELQSNQSAPISEWRFCFRSAFRFQNAVSVSEFFVLVSECRFNFGMRFLFQNIAFLFQNAVSVSEFCVSVSELRWPLCATVHRIYQINHYYYKYFRLPLTGTIYTAIKSLV